MLKFSKLILKSVALSILAGLLIVGCTKKISSAPAIGVLVPLSGPDAKIGESVRRALTDKLEQINSSGGFGGKPLELFFHDTAGEAASAYLGVNKLVEKERVFALIGPFTHNAAFAAAPLAVELKTPMIALFRACGSPAPEGKYIFDITPGESEYVAAAARSFKAAGGEKAFLFHSDEDCGKAGRDAWAAAAASQGIALPLVKSLDLSKEDAAEIAKEFRGEKPDAIFVFSDTPGAIGALEKLAGIAPLGRRIFLPPPEESEFITEGGEASAGAVSVATIFQLGELMADTNQRAAKIAGFKSAFQIKHSAAVNYQTTAAVDALDIILKAAGDRKPESGMKLVEAIESTPKFEGLLADYSFSGDDHSGFSSSYLFECRVESGRFRPIALDK